MFFKTVYSAHGNENIPHKVEAMYEEKAHITLFKKDYMWLVVFDDTTLPMLSFDSYADAKFFFDTAVIRIEKLINSRAAKDKALKELHDKTIEVNEAEDKFHEWIYER